MAVAEVVNGAEVGARGRSLGRILSRVPRRIRVGARGLARVRARDVVLDEEPNLNPSTGTEEFSLRDPDGYYVTISAI